MPLQHCAGGWGRVKRPPIPQGCLPSARLNGDGGCAPLPGLSPSPAGIFQPLVRAGAWCSRRHGVREHHPATASGRFGLTRAVSRGFCSICCQKLTFYLICGLSPRADVVPALISAARCRTHCARRGCRAAQISCGCRTSAFPQPFSPLRCRAE